MKINIKKIDFTIKQVEDKKYPDLLARVSIKFIDEHERFFCINGFTIRISKFNKKPYLWPPVKQGGFKFTLVEQSWWKELEKEIIDKYEFDKIPVID